MGAWQGSLELPWGEPRYPRVRDHDVSPSELRDHIFVQPLAQEAFDPSPYFLRASRHLSRISMPDSAAGSIIFFDGGEVEGGIALHRI